MTAQEFANANENVILFYAGVGCPAGDNIAMLDGTELPFSLDEVEGEVDADGTFNATNLTSGSGPRDWKFSDFRSNTIYKIQLYTDAKRWQEQHAEWMAGA